MVEHRLPRVVEEDDTGGRRLRGELGEGAIGKELGVREGDGLEFLSGAGIDDDGRALAGEFALKGGRLEEEGLFFFVAFGDDLDGLFEVDFVISADLFERVFFGKGAGLAAANMKMGEESASGRGKGAEKVSDWCSGVEDGRRHG